MQLAHLIFKLSMFIFNTTHISKMFYFRFLFLRRGLSLSSFNFTFTFQYTLYKELFRFPFNLKNLNFHFHISLIEIVNKSIKKTIKCNRLFRLLTEKENLVLLEEQSLLPIHLHFFFFFFFLAKLKENFLREFVLFYWKTKKTKTKWRWNKKPRIKNMQSLLYISSKEINKCFEVREKLL